MLPPTYTLSLTVISVLAGIAMLWIFRRFSDQERVALAKRKVRANLYAFRLYADEPSLVFRAQRQLLFWNARYLAAMLRPTVVLFLPTTLLLLGLEAAYGHRPLTPGESAVVTAQFSAASDMLQLAPALEGRHVTVETPSVRLPDARQVCWRIRPETSGAVVLQVDGASFDKVVVSGAPAGFLAERRVASLLDWLRYPGEARLPAGRLRWIGVSYPAASIDVLGFGINWLVWFIVVSLLTMLLAKRRFGVSF